MNDGMNTGWYHLVEDHVVARLLSDRPTLRCACCKQTYQRGHFRCCAPPTGMASHVWLSLTCPMPDQGGCGQCARHCQCPSKAARLGEGPLAQLGREFLQQEHWR